MKFPSFVFLVILLQVATSDLGAQIESDFLSSMETDTFMMAPGFFGSQVYMNCNRLKRTELLDIYSDYPSIQMEANKGFRQRHVGNILGSLSLAALIYTGITTEEGDDWSDLSISTKGAAISSIPLLVVGKIFAFKGEKKVIWSFKDFSRTLDQTDVIHPVIGTVFYNYDRRKLKLDEIQSAMKDYPDAWDKYSKGNKLEKIGWITTLSSLGAVIGVTAHQATQYPEEATNTTLIALGASFTGTLTGLVLGIVGSTKKLNSIKLMSEECNCIVDNTKVRGKAEGYWALGMTGHGLGISYTF